MYRDFLTAFYFIIMDSSWRWMGINLFNSMLLGHQLLVLLIQQENWPILIDQQFYRQNSLKNISLFSSLEVNNQRKTDCYAFYDKSCKNAFSFFRYYLSVWFTKRVNKNATRSCFFGGKNTLIKLHPGIYLGNNLLSW